MTEISIEVPPLTQTGDYGYERLGSGMRGHDSSAELLLVYSGDLRAAHLGEALDAFSRLYLVLSHPTLTPLERETLPAIEQLRVRKVSTENSLTALLVGAGAMAAGIPAAPILAGGAAVAGAVAWILRQRKTYHEGTKAKYEAEKAKHDAQRAELLVRRELREEAELINVGGSTGPLIEANFQAERFLVALDLDEDVDRAFLDGQDLSDT